MKTNEISAYKITWIEFRSVNGKEIPKNDLKVIRSGYTQRNCIDKSKLFLHFMTSERAIDYVKNIQQNNLSAAYEVRFFTDEQFELSEVDFKSKTHEIPFTSKQENEMFIIGK